MIILFLAFFSLLCKSIKQKPRTGHSLLFLNVIFYLNSSQKPFRHLLSVPFPYLNKDKNMGGETTSQNKKTALTKTVYTLNKKFNISPSCTTYSFPSARIFPASLQACSPPNFTKSSNEIVSARIKPRSKSEWIIPAH